LALLVEEERRPGGGCEQALTVFLAGSECPFTCVFCDLWRFTLDTPTPAGALPAQLRVALADEAVRRTSPQRIKLYNASNFFEPRAVPPQDLPVLADLLRPFSGVTVECHPLLVGGSCFEFADRIEGRLEVAMGLETVHPEALARLNKKLSLDEFEVAAARLLRGGVDLRAFVLVGAPFVPFQDDAAWVARSVASALDAGASVVSLIPVRPGNGELERLKATGEFHPPTLTSLEAAFEGALGLGRGIVVADLWDAERLPCCPECRTARLERLARMNRTGLTERAIACGSCAGSAARS
jgi:hypothetical protein